MKEIVKVLLQEGIDEETIHEVLSIIESKYEAFDAPSLKSVIRKAGRVADVNYGIMKDKMKSGDTEAEKRARKEYFKSANIEAEARRAKSKRSK